MNLSEHIHSNIVIITGHYGCGKTNLTMNMALDLAKVRDSVTVVDLDIVNPYFRISDSTQLLESKGVSVVAPNFAGTSLDTPSLSPKVMNAIEMAGKGETLTLIDVGGDPDGATTLARFKQGLNAAGYQMMYVVNQRRLQTTYAAETKELLDEIEMVSGLKGTCIVGNTHLKGETTAQTIVDSIPFNQGVSEITGLPVEFITATSTVYQEVESLLKGTKPAPPEVFPVDVYIKTPWE